MEIEQKIAELLASQMRETLESFEPIRSCIVCREVIARGGLCSCDIEKGRIAWTEMK